MTTPREALENLRTNQTQLDMDGCVVGVSRQALEEVLEYCASLEGNQRTAGTVERCQHYASASCGENEDHPNMGVCGRKNCPLKVKVTK